MKKIRYILLMAVLLMIVGIHAQAADKGTVFFSHSFTFREASDGYRLYAYQDGDTKILFMASEYTVNGVKCVGDELMEVLPEYDGVIEYTLNEDGKVSEIKTLEVLEEFSDIGAVDGKFNGYNINEIISYNVIDINLIYAEEYGEEVEPHEHEWQCKKTDFSDGYIYSGYTYKTSDDKIVLWLSERNVITGFPEVSFSAKERYNIDDVGYIRLYSGIDLNGYEGGGLVLLVVYEDGRPIKILSCQLSAGNRFISYDFYYEKGITPFIDYEVKGFVWDENLSPIYNAVDVEIE